MPIIDWSWTFSDWFLLIIILSTAVYFYGTSTFGHFSRQYVPHDRPIPFVGNMGSTVFRRQSFPGLVAEIYNKFADDQYCGFYLFKQPVILLRDPELIKTIAVKDFKYFTDHNIRIHGLDTAWTNGLFNLKGQRWKEMRSTLSPAFTSSKMKTMFTLMSECCEQMVKYLEKCHQFPKNGDIKKDGNMLEIELKDLYSRYTNDVIASTVFGVAVDSLEHPKNEFFMMGQNATNFEGFQALKWILLNSAPKLWKLLGISLIPKRVTEFFRKLVLETISVREKEGIERPDILQLLMQAKKGVLEDDNSNNNNRIKLDDEDVVAQALLFLLAGFETSTLLCFASHQLAVHNDVQSRLQEEIDITLKKNEGKLTFESINHMKYLDMVVSEILRMYPPAASVDRICVRNYILHADPPIEFQPGDALLIPIFGLHRDPKYFYDPHRFDPDRFSDENKYKMNPLTYLPFGIGPRSCIGSHFALMESKMLLVHLLSKFNLQITNRTPVPLKLAQKGFNISIDGGFWLGIEPRN